MKRHALFVGVNNYMDKDIRNLRYSIPDAAVLADRFKGFGYKTRLLSDPTSAELRAVVLDSIDGLGRGDVFLFFFAGHGFTAQDGSHLLFCRDDIRKLLRVGNAGVKVDALEMLTCEGGFHRAFFLDSCRTDCFTGVENRGNEETRDLDFVKIPEPTDETGSYYLLRSCDKFRPSLEIKELGHGLFTQGLLDAIDARDRRLGGCNTDFATAVSVKMADRQKQYNVGIFQRPSIGVSSGSVFSLFDDEFFSDMEKSDLSTMQSSPRVSTLPAAATPTYVVCPICGKKNKVEDTFKCRQCGSDNLCLRHQDEKTFLCCNCSDEKRKSVKSAPSPQSMSAKDAYERGENYRYARYGFGQDYAEAVKWYRKAAEQGHARAQYALGFMYESGRGVTQDDSEAVKWYRKAAEQGDASAQSNLGLMYESGRGVTKDDSEAVKWYRKAAKQGNANAQFALGVMYQNGRGVTKDDSEAVKWYRKAAKQGNANAQSNLGVCYEDGRGVLQDYAEAVKWYRKAAEQGHAHAQCNLGLVYESGRGVTKDDSEAVKWYRKAAEQGHAHAQCNLGWMYENGRGVPTDDSETVKWYRKAVEQGHARAQCALGLMYERGRGVKQDDSEAVKWYRKAAEQGHAYAQCNLGFMYENGRGVPTDDSEAVKWYRKAAEQGHARAQFCIGLMYESGRCFQRNYEEAAIWYRIAISNGYEQAKEHLKIVEK